MSKSSPLESTLSQYDVIIVGGGITGAGIFRDLALHGLSCLLIDKKDFTSQTSQSSSKMLHGGIRYLENMDFGLVHEALHEKNLWLKLAPHLCFERPFHLPIYKESKQPLWMIKAGLFLYDFLSGFQNTPHRNLNSEQTQQAIPGIRTRGLRGAGVYYDAIVDDAKLTLEVIYDALKNNQCKALNHVELSTIKKLGNENQLNLRDCLTLEEKTITAKNIVFATGPFTDRLLEKFPEIKWAPKLLPSKGSHLWIKPEKLPLPHPMVMNTKEGRVIFVVPQKGAVLVGTTEEIIEGDFFDIKPSQKEITYLIQNLNDYFPDNRISEDDILSSFAGIRPLVKEGDSNDLGKTAREHKCYQPRSNVHVIIGGKYTTFRSMGQEISRQLVQERGLSYSSSLTKSPLRQISRIKPFIKKKITSEDLKDILGNESPRTFEDLVVRRLGIATKKHWLQDQSFDSFFKENLALIQSFIDVDESEIINFS